MKNETFAQTNINLDDNPNNIETPHNSNLTAKKTKIDDNIDYQNNSLLISKIFKISQKNNNIIPILNKNSSVYLKKLFSTYPELDDHSQLHSFILNKINFFKKIQEIIDNSYEILYILFDYLSLYDISPINYFIKLYIDYICLVNKKNITNENKLILLNEINEILTWFISCGLLKKNNIDFLLQKIAEFQLYNQLSIQLFRDILPLAEIIYGKNINDLLINNFIAKKYIYLYDKDTSLITTNVSRSNPIFIKKGFCVMMWFYLNNLEENIHCTLCQVLTEECKKIDLVLSENNDINIVYNTYTPLKEKNNKTFNIIQRKWTQLIFQLDEKGAKLYLSQNNTGEENTEAKIEEKIYLISNESYKNDKSNENINYIDFKSEKYNIISLIFLVGFVGDVGSIIFCDSTEQKGNKTDIDSVNGIENKKVMEFIMEKKIPYKLYFIFSPSLYIFDNNKFSDCIHNVIGELTPNTIHLKNDILNLNSVLIFHNYTKNIFYLGGCKNVLPLFEILYKFSINYDLTEKDIINLCEIFNLLIKLIEIIFINKTKNCLNSCKYETDFFETLKIFLEKLNEKFYTLNNNDKQILESLISIGTYFSDLVSQNILVEDEPLFFFDNILFNPIILMKFSFESQKKLIKFFIEIQKKNPNLIISMSQINKLLMTISKKNKNEKYDLKILFEYIKIIFEKSTDNEKESLFLLYCDEKISDEIFAYIMKIFSLYFEIKLKDELKEKKEIGIKNILDSPNYFIENLLYFFSGTNIHIKKAIINFILILTQTHGNILENYFTQIEKINRKNKNKGRITKEEFYNFIQENITPKYSNKYISEPRSISTIFYLEENENNKNTIEINNNINNNNNLKRKYSFDIFKPLTKEDFENYMISHEVNKNDEKKSEEMNNSNTNIKEESICPPNSHKNIKINYYRKRSSSEQGSKKIRKIKQNNLVNNYSIINKEWEILNTSKNDNKNNSNNNNIIVNSPLSKIFFEDFNINTKKTDTQSENNCGIAKFKSSMALNIDLINEEYEISVNNFSKKIKLLASHCVNYNLGIETNKICHEFLYSDKYTPIGGIENEKIINDFEIIEKEPLKIKKKLNNAIKRSNSMVSLSFNNDYKIDLSSKKEYNDLDEKEKLIIQNTKVEISLILNNWLTPNDKNKNKPEYIDQVINLLVNFISHSKELEVIFQTLFLILSQKDNNICDKKQSTINISEVYKKLLFYLFNNKNFLQLLEELTIISYVGKSDNKYNYLLNDFLYITDNLKDRANCKDKMDYFIKINNICHQLLIDILTLENNNDKNKITINIFNLVLKITNILENKNIEKGIDIFIQFLNEFFMELSDIYHNMFNSFDSDDNNKDELIKDYIGLLKTFFDYSIIAKVASPYLNNKQSNQNSVKVNSIPSFITSKILYDSEKNNWMGYEIFEKIISDLKIIFTIDKLFTICNITKKTNEENNNDANIKMYNAKEVQNINKLMKFLIENRTPFPKLKEYFEFLFIEYDNFPIINIFSVFYNNSLYMFFANTSEIQKINLIQLLNNFQNYILFLLLISCYMKEEDNKKQNIINQDNKKQNTRDYKKQTIIYRNLLYSIKNIICRVNNSTYGKYFVNVFYNVLLVASKIYLIYQDDESKNKQSSNFLKKMFTKHLNLKETAPVKLINYYNELYPEFFNKENFEIFSCNRDEGIATIMNSKKTLFDIFSRVNENNNSENINVENIEKIYQKKLNAIKDLRFLINISKEKTNQNNPINSQYKTLFLKIKNLKTSYVSDNIKKYQKQFFAIKNYKKIKKNLYSFNNSYSNLPVFYPEKNINNNNKKVLKFKLSNFLSKDMTRKFLVPILDIDSYILNFRHFDYKENNIFYHSKNKIYSVDLKIFNNYGKYPIIPNKFLNDDEFKNYYILENVCYIKTTHHICGIFFVEKNIKTLDKNSCFYFSVCELKSHKILLNTRADYDSLNKTCFGSIFRNNRNKKDINVYLKIYFKDIIFIFNRKYSFRDNSFELYLSNNRSYYFKCKNKKDRDEFVEFLVKSLNTQNIFSKKLFKPIKSNDWKSKIIGYYKNINSNKNYTSIEEIKDNWKNNKISTLEYLMWINLYGNRSFRDVAQYPVFPWILCEYNFNNTEELIKNFESIIRNFNLPMGMLALDESGKQRRDNYIFSYRTMVSELNEQDIININFEKEDSIISNNSHENSIDNSKDNINKSINENNENSSITENDDKKKDDNLPIIPHYSFNVEKLYMDLDIDMENIPYFYGSHYSNAMYVSHYLARLFPYSLIMIEIQASGFDCPDRLFLNFERTFSSASSEKCDLRELIPEIFTVPELFLNLNRFNFGKVYINDYNGALDELLEINKKYNDYEIKENNTINNENKNSHFSSGSENLIEANVEDVVLPKWCSKNPYLYILNYREFLEKKILNLNPWIDLIFGETQSGKKAQICGNCFLPYTYDGVIDFRLKENEILKDRKNCEHQMRLFELGVNPVKVFNKQCSENKKTVIQIPAIKNYSDAKIFGVFDMSKIKINPIFLQNIGNNYNDFFIIDKSFLSFKLLLKYNSKENNYSYELSPYKELPVKNLIQFNTAIYKLIIKTIFDEGIILLTGFYDGSLYILNLNEKIINADKDINNYQIYSKIKKKDSEILKLFGHGLITTLEISKDEKYMLYGTEKGTLVIFSFDYFFYNEDKNNDYINLLKIIQSHSRYKINSVSINSDLNIFADCAYDGYVNIYTLPKCELINSIYVDTKKFLIDNLFLTAQPLASVILYSNQDFLFKSYNINGHDLNIKESDIDLYTHIEKNCCGDEYMTSINFFTDYQFVDYMLYLFGNRYIILRKMPLMERVFKFNLGEQTHISLLNISLCKRYIYALEKNENKLFFIEYKNMNNQN